MATFKSLTTEAGLKQLNEHLLTKSYISGYQASKDDLSVWSALAKAPDAKTYPNAARWWSHVKALLGASFPGEAKGVSVEGVSSAPAASAAPEEPAAADDDDEIYSNSDSDDSLDLFGEMTDEEKAAAEAKKKLIAECKARGAEKAKLTKSLIIMDVKPWDDSTDMEALEAEVRAITKDGLLWGASKLMPVGYGIKKLQITCVIEDSKVESMDAIIEEELVRDGESETIQSIDIVSFNKL